MLQDAQARNRLVSVHTNPENLDRCRVGFVDAVTATHVRLRAVMATGRILGYAVRRLEDVVQVEIDSPYLQRVEALASCNGDIFEKVIVPAGGENAEDKAEDRNRDLIRELIGIARDHGCVARLLRFSADCITGWISATTDLHATIEPIDMFGKAAATVSVPWRDVESVDFETEEEQICRFLATQSKEAPSISPVSSGRSQASPRRAATRQRRASGRDIGRLLTDAQAENCLVSVHADPENLNTCGVGFVDAVTDTQVRLRAVMATGKVLGYSVERIDSLIEVQVGDPYLQRMAALVAHDGNIFEEAHVSIDAGRAESGNGEDGDLIRAAIETARGHGSMVTLYLFSGDELLTGCITATTDLHATIEPIDRYGKATAAQLVSWRDMEAVDFETDDEQIHRFLSTQPCSACNTPSTPSS